MGRGSSAGGGGVAHGSLSVAKAVQIGDDLYAINKMAKNLRDARYIIRYPFSDWSIEDSKNADNLIKEVLNMSAEEYNNATETSIHNRVKAKEQELYTLKQEVIDKAKEKGIKDVGYHDFVRTDKYGSKNYTSARYIIIGKQGFHYDEKKYRHTDIPNLGEIHGMIASQKDVKYSQAIIDRLKKFVNSR